jgi:hypothetical protein
MLRGATIVDPVRFANSMAHNERMTLNLQRIREENNQDDRVDVAAFMLGLLLGAFMAFGSVAVFWLIKGML